MSEKDSATNITRYRITEQDLVVSVSGKYDHIHNVERFLLLLLLFISGGGGGIWEGELNAKSSTNKRCWAGKKTQTNKLKD